MRCPGCYHQPDNSADPSIAEVVEIARMVTSDSVGLLGAESTMREDLPELIAAIREATGKTVMMYTNGLRLASADYCRTLKAAGLMGLDFSMHLPGYVGQKIFELKQKAFQTIREEGLFVSHISYSLTDLDQVPDALTHAMTLGLPSSTYTRFRVSEGQISLPDLVERFLFESRKRHYQFECLQGSHSYGIFVRVDGNLFLLLSWPTVENVDLGDLQLVPVRGLLNPELGELPMVQAGLIFEHRRKVLQINKG